MKGIDFHKNPGNGFAVFRLHYTADPDKDPSTPAGAEWYAKARHNVSDADWNKEMEIDWFALSGDLVYPTFSKDIHVVAPFEIPADWTRYRTIDSGFRNPTAILWAAVDKEDNVYLYREYYQAGKIVQEIANDIKAVEKGEKILYGVIDPATEAKNPVNGESVANTFRKCGITVKAANNDVQAGIDVVTEYLNPDEHGRPRVYVFSTLLNFLTEVKDYRWEDLTGAQAASKDPKEKPRKKADHLMDAWRYLMIERPRYVKTIRFKPEKAPTWGRGLTTGYV